MGRALQPRKDGLVSAQRSRYRLLGLYAARVAQWGSLPVQ